MNINNLCVIQNVKFMAAFKCDNRKIKIKQRRIKKEGHNLLSNIVTSSSIVRSGGFREKNEEK